LKSINHQVVIKFQQNRFKQEAKYYCLQPTSLVLFGIRKNFLISRSLLLYQFTKRVTKIDCNNYCGISLLSTSLSNIFLSRLVPYIDEIIGDHQCGFRRNRSTTDQIFCIRHILEEKWEYNETVHQLFIDFKKAYDSVRREVLYNRIAIISMLRETLTHKTLKAAACASGTLFLVLNWREF
jgi:hypothetical protein